MREPAASFQEGVGGPRPVSPSAEAAHHTPVCSEGWGALSPESCSHRRLPGPTILTNVAGTSAVAFSLILVRPDKEAAGRLCWAVVKGGFRMWSWRRKPAPSRPLSPAALHSTFDQQTFCNEGRTAGGCRCAPPESAEGAVVPCFVGGGGSSLSSAHRSPFMKPSGAQGTSASAQT